MLLEKINGTASDLVTVSQGGLEPLAHRLAAMLSMPVLLTDSHYFPIASAAVDGSEACGEILAVERHDMDEKDGVFMCRIMTLDAEEIGWGTPVQQGGKTLGYWFILDGKNTLSIAQARSVLGFISPLAALHLQKQLELRLEKQNFKEPFLYDLLYGNIKSRIDIIEYGKIWNWDLSLPQQVIVFSLTDFSHISADRHILSSLLYTVEKTLIDRLVRPITMMRDNQVIVIISYDELNGITADFTNAFTVRVLDQMETRYSGRQFGVGIGKEYDRPSDLFRSFQEAKVALDLGHLLDIRQPYFTALGLERILYKHDSQDLKEYYQETLGPLIAMDSETSENGLLETLEAYCSHQFDITATSKALFLHRNTLRYRLKKIEDILGIKLDDFNNKLNITAAIKIKQLRKI